ncbi:helix-turn-helix domain-containing protein [Clostridium saccharobutylicum]|uniref:Helix-turn-helix domain protein n=1 Tax=Clostridium saccharobutylicum DSM 13864 TaxID=1345695 RepID=U5MWW0_CLOSA|nr:helix-turn-helix transcriptional regulator [Clostridium saccharobutylicum]AGX43912.1 helix-turn-helix domain protein [Clostridium saccharobutylicum DSM 13864]AQR91209.1 helix-turn-helix domain protein [Clostridium saccharobutylicum]AQS01113.1 helix-turn-helix domain protein [Clostridium saccharobutylicum]AQS15096.1 helix-turn-helix domain protein [Clostridium saccharobutylicum]MBA2905222.1 transcriptional regulator with XRE-family HTH domain [Clostridium saccharobutylicum]
MITDVNTNDSDLTFGAILSRKRKELKLSFKELEEKLAEDDPENPVITASYLNRIENGKMDNPSFKIVCFLVEKLNLDLNEVMKSFGFKLGLSNNNKFKDIEQFIRLSDIEAPLFQDGGEIYERKNLTLNEKKLLNQLIENFFTYGVAYDSALVARIKDTIEIMEKYRESRVKIYNADVTE